MGMPVRNRKKRRPRPSMGENALVEQRNGENPTRTRDTGDGDGQRH